MTSQSQEILVVGAGIVGLSVALQLQLDGFKVTVVDQDEPMQGCSAGNAGYLSQANIFPPAAPDLLLRFPRLLMASDGPLVISPAYLDKMVPWSLRAVSALRPARYSQTINAFASLITRSQNALVTLARAADASHLLTQEGGLIAYRTQQALQSKQRLIPMWREHGIEVETLSAEAMLAMEPALARDLVGGLFFPRSGRCSNPRMLGLRYLKRLLAGGGRLVAGQVAAIRRNASTGWDVDINGVPTRTDKVVVCAGYQSERLIKGCGFKRVMVSERGYHLMLPQPHVTLSRPIVFGEPLFAATPMQEGLRLAGTAEFCKATAKPNMDRAYMLESIAAQYIPKLRSDDAQPWMGVRPTLPDGLPAIGETSPGSGFFYAFGHSHNGLMMSAISAQCIAAMAQGRLPPIDVLPLDLHRFN
jgi:glycine/D-amino acid oxidase-like deaminating enzyme